MIDKEKAISYLEWIRPQKPYSLDRKNVQESIDMAINALKEKTPWIPLKYRPMDNDEYRAFRKEYGEIPVEERLVFNCNMPDAGQEILITTKYGHIFLDTCVLDSGGYGLEEYGDWEDVIAWLPLPEPYKKEGDPE